MKKESVFLVLCGFSMTIFTATQPQQSKQQPLVNLNKSDDLEDEAGKAAVFAFFGQLVPAILRVCVAGKDDPEQATAGIAQFTQGLSNFVTALTVLSRDPVTLCNLLKEENEQELRTFVRKYISTEKLDVQSIA